MRLPTPAPEYDKENEAATRRIIEQELSRETDSFVIGGGVLSVVKGALQFKSAKGTVTVLAPA